MSRDDGNEQRGRGVSRGRCGTSWQYQRCGSQHGPGTTALCITLSCTAAVIWSEVVRHTNIRCSKRLLSMIVVIIKFACKWQYSSCKLSQQQAQLRGIVAHSIMADGDADTELDRLMNQYSAEASAAAEAVREKDRAGKAARQGMSARREDGLASQLPAANKCGLRSDVSRAIVVSSTLVARNARQQACGSICCDR